MTRKGRSGESNTTDQPDSRILALQVEAGVDLLLAKEAKAGARRVVGKLCEAASYEGLCSANEVLVKEGERLKRTEEATKLKRNGEPHPPKPPIPMGPKRDRTNEELPYEVDPNKYRKQDLPGYS